ncbi:MDR family oxidoreductase [Balneatrix alpica]|uniref:MDR family oxidoreductase n=1 Tax=Balneatrix alpica TaxID=75684 RepID=A0ABV5Z6A1_9GAMM|nr:MDR family oxidoreductase [Balneatrix alpica]
MFNALVLKQQETGLCAQIERLSTKDLPDEPILVEVAYSSLNYKDGLAVTGNGKIVHQYPMVPGIDLAGRILQSADPHWQAGDQVILTGWGVGERYWGGYAQQMRVKGEWLVPCPSSLSALEAMSIGTAGLTAMLCVMALEQGQVAAGAPVLVTGAAGGVGSFAVALLAALGYEVHALTGRTETHDYLRHLGAEQIIDRSELQQPAKPLESQRWAGVIDTVGDQILAKALAQCQYGATVAACGLAAGFKLPTTVMPFILRNVRLQGVDSVMCPRPLREQAWQRLAALVPPQLYQQGIEVVGLEEVVSKAEAIVSGRVKGRVVVDPNL